MCLFYLFVRSKSALKTHILTKQTGFFCPADIYRRCFLNFFNLKRIIWQTFTWQSFGISNDEASLWGIKSSQEPVLTPLWFGRILTRGWFRHWALFVGEPSWPGRATRYQADTSTAFPCPPTPTFSPTCWGACRLRLCQDFPSVDIAPPPQQVSQLFSLFSSACWRFCVSAAFYSLKCKLLLEW